MDKKVDITDRRILELLTKDARISYAEIGRHVYLSRVAIRDRIKKMEDNGVITGYSVIIDKNALGLKVAVFLEIEVLPIKLESVAMSLSEMKEVSIVYQMTGPTILHVHVFIENHYKLSRFLNEKVFLLEGITKATAYILLKNFKTNLSIK